MTSTHSIHMGKYLGAIFPRDRFYQLNYFRHRGYPGYPGYPGFAGHSRVPMGAHDITSEVLQS